MTPEAERNRRAGGDRRRNVRGVQLAIYLVVLTVSLCVAYGLILSVVASKAEEQAKLAKVQQQLAMIVSTTARQTYQSCVERVATSTSARDNARATLDALSTSDDPSAVVLRRIVQSQYDTSARNADVDCGSPPPQIPTGG